MQLIVKDERGDLAGTYDTNQASAYSVHMAPDAGRLIEVVLFRFTEGVWVRAEIDADSGEPVSARIAPESVAVPELLRAAADPDWYYLDELAAERWFKDLGIDRRNATATAVTKKPRWMPGPEYIERTFDACAAAIRKASKPRDYMELARACGVAHHGSYFRCAVRALEKSGRLIVKQTKNVGGDFRNMYSYRLFTLPGTVSAAEWDREETRVRQAQTGD